MSSFTTGQPSSSVGDYLKAIWEISGSGAASTKDVAARLAVSSASVMNIFGQLQEMGLVRYERYCGASLARSGLEEALRLVRRHGLIETFLMKHLRYSCQDVHEEAEKLEHAVSGKFTGRLAEFLGHSDRDPHGDLIPAADGTLALKRSQTLERGRGWAHGTYRQGQRLECAGLEPSREARPYPRAYVGYQAGAHS
ncbi:MAG: metal-dependent transcriptional regulator [Rubrobacter sp.]|nr:metal-dependent transcriptional regulator [Rubrobacter sp.]